MELDQDQDLSFIDDIKSLSTMPAIIVDLLALLNDSTTQTKQIDSKLKLDPGIVAYLLKCCNSPLFGIRKEVNSIPMAINLLGFTNLKSMIMTHFTKGIYGSSTKEKIPNHLWKHSISIAVFAKQLSGKLGYKDEETYMAGLLHDIGKLVLYFHDPDKFEIVFSKVQKDKEEFITAELDTFGFSHVETGFYLMGKWGFSEFLKNAIMYHHEEDSFLSLNKEFRLIPFANLLAHNALENGEYDLEPFTNLFNLTPNQLDQVISEALYILKEYQ